jgi:hypothetical protein
MGIKDDRTKRELLIVAGFDEEVRKAMLGICPFCDTPVTVEDFRDDLSRREFHISGMCQKCQDIHFQEPEE